MSLTVFLTLSAESNAAKEELPKVSYVKVQIYLEDLENNDSSRLLTSGLASLLCSSLSPCSRLFSSLVWNTKARNWQGPLMIK